MISAYARAVDDPRPAAGDNAVRAMLREWEINHLRTADLSSASVLDRALADTADNIPDEVKRATLAVAYRPWLRRPLFSVVRFSYRIKARVGRRSATHEDMPS